MPPPVTPTSPLIALVDTQIDVDHPEIAGSNITTTGGAALTRLPRHRHAHGRRRARQRRRHARHLARRARAQRAAARRQRITLRGLRARDQRARSRAGAAVINMSYGSPAPCTAEDAADPAGGKAGAVPVAAAGNEFANGNPLEFPASLPHVITVARDRARRQADLLLERERRRRSQRARRRHPHRRPGRVRPTTAPPDGFAASPARRSPRRWSRPRSRGCAPARPDLTPVQAAQVVRLGARDIGTPGYENSTGFGALSLRRRARAAAAADDPLEPNDDIRYVDGRAFGGAAPPLFTGRRRAIAATADFAEDPVDVYRVKVGARAGACALTLVADRRRPRPVRVRPEARSVRKSGSLRSSSKHAAARPTDRLRNSGRGRDVLRRRRLQRAQDAQLFNTSYVLRAR